MATLFFTTINNQICLPIKAFGQISTICYLNVVQITAKLELESNTTLATFLLTLCFVDLYSGVRHMLKTDR